LAARFPSRRGKTANNGLDQSLRRKLIANLLTRDSITMTNGMYVVQKIVSKAIFSRLSMGGSHHSGSLDAERRIRIEDLRVRYNR
jgi:hypothetical protein